MPDRQENIGAESPWSKKYEPEIINLGGQDVEVIDAEASEQSSDIPILYSPGWNPDGQVLRQIVPSITQGGRRGIAFSAPHGIPVDSTDPVERKSEAVHALLENKEIEQVDAIGHSEAGLYLVEAALKNPERFRSILLVNPAGINGPDTIPKLSFRFVQGMVSDFAGRCRDLFERGEHQKHSRLLRHYVRGAKSSLSPQSPREVQAMSERQIPEKLRELRAKGVRVSIIQTTDDKAFPPSQNQLSEDDCDSYLEVEGSHDFPIVEPERFMSLALQELEKQIK